MASFSTLIITTSKPEHEAALDAFFADSSEEIKAAFAGPFAADGALTWYLTQGSIDDTLVQHLKIIGEFIGIDSLLRLEVKGKFIDCYQLINDHQGDGLEYNLVIHGFTKKIPAIKALRTIFGSGLKESKVFLDEVEQTNQPRIIAWGRIETEKVESVERILQDAGVRFSFVLPEIS